MKKYNHKSKKKPTERVGFYIALSICLVAIGLAVWSTYSSVSEYLSNQETEYFSSLVPETSAMVAQDVTGVTVESTESVSQPATETTHSDISLYESSTIPRTESANAESELDSLQAVLKVTDSLIYPVDSESVLREYSETAVYNPTMKDYRPHTGTDFVANEGDSVYSMCDGVVSSISFDEHYGVIIKVSTDTYTVYYCGVDSDTNVKMNDQVSTGDVLGTVSQIPSECEDPVHLHVEIKVGDKYIDPLTVISSDM